MHIRKVVIKLAKAPLTVSEIISKLNDLEDDSQVMVQLEDDEDGNEQYSIVVDLREEAGEEGPVVVLELQAEDEDED